MNRRESFELLKKNLNNKNLIKHSLAVEAGMRGLANYFHEDDELWSICGLLHDIDYEIIGNNLELHSKKGSEMLRELMFDEELCEAVLTHNEAHGIEPKSIMAKALFSVDPLTGLIVASTLVLPSKKINDLKVESVLKKFKINSFARGAKREIISKCEESLGISLEEFIKIVLIAMQGISDDLGL